MLCEPGKFKDKKFPFCLQLKTANKMYYFNASSAMEMHEWMWTMQNLEVIISTFNVTYH
jgi:hypothetical protein